MRLIDADALMRKFKTASPMAIDGRARQMVEDMPTIEERKRGEWVWLSSTYDRTPCEMRYMCSECHHETILHSNESSDPWEKYCPHCGADMRGDRL